MNVAVICELNPMHNGHEAVFKFARNLGRGGNTVVAVMSGNYCQRGEPALIDKWSRAKMAVLGGADIVLEIPSVFAQQSAQFFADAAVDVVCRSGICDALVFGSECGDIELLKGLAGKRAAGDFGDAVKKLMDSGLSYPRALSAFYGVELGANDTLGVEYIVALEKRLAAVEVSCMKRIGGNVHGNCDMDEGSEIAGAAAIRKYICEKEAGQDGGLERLRKFMPESSLEILDELVKEGRFVRSLNKYNTLIIGKLRELGPEGIGELPFAGGGLAECVYSEACRTSDTANLIASATSKTFTSGRIRRILLATLTGARQTMIRDRIDVPYVRVLGVSAERKDLLSGLSDAKVPVIFGNIPKDYRTSFSCNGADLLALEILATDYYVLGFETANAPAHLELTMPLIKV